MSKAEQIMIDSLAWHEEVNRLFSKLVKYPFLVHSMQRDANDEQFNFGDILYELGDIYDVLPSINELMYEAVGQLRNDQLKALSDCEDHKQESFLNLLKQYVNEYMVSL